MGAAHIGLQAYQTNTAAAKITASKDMTRSDIMEGLSFHPSFVNSPSPAPNPAIMDMITLGSDTSEKDHGLQGERTEVTTGAFGEKARHLLPTIPATFQGGTIRFTMKVDPARQNYFTAKFWARSSAKIKAGSFSSVKASRWDTGI